MSADQRLADLGLTLPSPPKPIGNYVPFRLAGNLLFLSGVGPRHADEKMVTGKVGADLTVEQGYEAAKLCGLNLLVNMIAAVGTLHPASGGDQRLHRSAGAGAGGRWPTSALGGRHGQPAAQHCSGSRSGRLGSGCLTTPQVVRSRVSTFQVPARTDPAALSGLHRSSECGQYHDVDINDPLHAHTTRARRNAVQRRGCGRSAEHRIAGSP
jgi:hypothetical protein